VETPPQAAVPVASRRALPASAVREQAAHQEAQERLARVTEGRAGVLAGTRWNIRLQREPCARPAPPEAPVAAEVK